MYWEEDKNLTEDKAHLVTDVSFNIRCRAVPIDHAWDLQDSLLSVMPWLSDEPLAGIHNIHISEAGHGWFRPIGPKTEMLLSKRTRLKIRIPVHRLDDVKSITGETIHIAGNQLTILKCHELSIESHSAIFARHILLNNNEDETGLMHRVVPQLEIHLESKLKKVLCGKKNIIQTPKGPLQTQSLMIADLKKHESIRIQEIGAETGGGLLGCGLFIPHKGIEAVNKD